MDCLFHAKLSLARQPSYSTCFVDDLRSLSNSVLGIYNYPTHLGLRKLGESPSMAQLTEGQNSDSTWLGLTSLAVVSPLRTGSPTDPAVSKYCFLWVPCIPEGLIPGGSELCLRAGHRIHAWATRRITFWILLEMTSLFKKKVCPG